MAPLSEKAKQAIREHDRNRRIYGPKLHTKDPVAKFIVAALYPCLKKLGEEQ